VPPADGFTSSCNAFANVMPSQSGRIARPIQRLCGVVLDVTAGINWVAFFMVM
jgi:hypothetical protein